MFNWFFNTLKTIARKKKKEKLDLSKEQETQLAEAQEELLTLKEEFTTILNKANDVGLLGILSDYLPNNGYDRLLHTAQSNSFIRSVANAISKSEGGNLKDSTWFASGTESAYYGLVAIAGIALNFNRDKFDKELANAKNDVERENIYTKFAAELEDFIKNHLVLHNDAYSSIEDQQAAKERNSIGKNTIFDKLMSARFAALTIGHYKENYVIPTQSTDTYSEDDNEELASGVVLQDNLTPEEAMLQQENAERTDSNIDSILRKVRSEYGDTYPALYHAMRRYLNLFKIDDLDEKVVTNIKLPKDILSELRNAGILPEEKKSNILIEVVAKLIFDELNKKAELTYKDLPTIINNVFSLQAQNNLEELPKSTLHKIITPLIRKYSDYPSGDRSTTKEIGVLISNAVYATEDSNENTIAYFSDMVNNAVDEKYINADGRRMTVKDAKDVLHLLKMSKNTYSTLLKWVNTHSSDVIAFDELQSLIDRLGVVFDNPANKGASWYATARKNTHYDTIKEIYDRIAGDTTIKGKSAAFLDEMQKVFANKKAEDKAIRTFLNVVNRRIKTVQEQLYRFVPNFTNDVTYDILNKFSDTKNKVIGKLTEDMTSAISTEKDQDKIEKIKKDYAAYKKEVDAIVHDAEYMLSSSLLQKENDRLLPQSKQNEIFAETLLSNEFKCLVETLEDMRDYNKNFPRLKETELTPLESVSNKYSDTNGVSKVIEDPTTFFDFTKSKQRELYDLFISEIIPAFKEKCITYRTTVLNDGKYDSTTFDEDFKKSTGSEYDFAQHTPFRPYEIAENVFDDGHFLPMVFNALPTDKNSIITDVQDEEIYKKLLNRVEEAYSFEDDNIIKVVPYKNKSHKTKWYRYNESTDSFSQMDQDSIIVDPYVVYDLTSRQYFIMGKNDKNTGHKFDPKKVIVSDIQTAVENPARVCKLSAYYRGDEDINETDQVEEVKQKLKTKILKLLKECVSEVRHIREDGSNAEIDDAGILQNIQSKLENNKLFSVLKYFCKDDETFFDECFQNDLLATVFSNAEQAISSLKKYILEDTDIQQSVSDANLVEHDKDVKNDNISAKPNEQPKTERENIEETEQNTDLSGNQPTQEENDMATKAGWNFTGMKVTAAFFKFAASDDNYKQFDTDKEDEAQGLIEGFEFDEKNTEDSLDDEKKKKEEFSMERLAKVLATIKNGSKEHWKEIRKLVQQSTPKSGDELLTYLDIWAANNWNAEKALRMYNEQAVELRNRSYFWSMFKRNVWPQIQNNPSVVNAVNKLANDRPVEEEDVDTVEYK